MGKGEIHQVIVSGVTGFVGSNLERTLNSQYYIKGISRRPKIDQGIMSYNHLDKDELSSAIAFIHLAGKAHDLKKTSDDKEYFHVNTELTKKLFDQFLNSDCEVFIFLSSVKAVADSVEGVLKEDATPNPLTAYGRSKRAAEEYLLSKQLPQNKRLYILRPSMIHGPGNKGNLNLLYQVMKKGIPFPLGAFENKRSFASVENLCFIIKNLIEKRPPSGIYQVADDEALSTVDLVRTMGEAEGKKVTILNLPKGAIKVLAGIGDTLRLPLNTERLGKLTENYVVSNDRIKEALGAELPLSTREGIKRTIQSFQTKR